MGEINLAIKLLEYILEIRAEEPQSYRDLALALVDNGQYQKACDLLYELALKEWDDRFYGINTTALVEMNSIISKYPGKVNLSRYDKRLIYSMPMDIMVKLRWDVDNTDLDLWVTDPNNEKCDYSNKETAIRGYLLQDFTEGYGPEIFMLKKAKNGNYLIECNYFGSDDIKFTGGATLFLDLYTNFGKPNETKKTIVKRLLKEEDIIKIGEFDFKQSF